MERPPPSSAPSTPAAAADNNIHGSAPPGTGDSTASSIFCIGSLHVGDMQRSVAETPLPPASPPMLSPSPQPVPFNMRPTDHPPPPPPTQPAPQHHPPNYPSVKSLSATASDPFAYVREPLFFIPRVPELTQVPAPAPPKKAPLAGYDMRTLRKQVDFLHGELAERAETQRLLHAQNTELWGYATALGHAHHANAATTKAHVARLYVELREAHAERAKLADQLGLAEGAKDVLTRLRADHAGMAGALDEAKRLNAVAEADVAALRGAEQEEDAAVAAAHAKAAQAHARLDELRDARREASGLARADLHWRTSRATLRGALARFRRAVGRQRRGRLLHALMARVRRHHLLGLCWARWGGFLARRAVMAGNAAKRRREGLVLVLARWKLFAALERMCAGTGRRRALAKTFSGWARVARGEAKARAFRRRREVRGVIRAWQRQTSFLEWRSPRLARLEVKANRHFAARVLRAWLATARAEQASVAALVASRLGRGPGAGLRAHFGAWRGLFLAQRHRRTELMRRFFVHASQLVTARATRASVRSLWAYATRLGEALRRSTALHRWARWARTHSRGAGKEAQAKVRYLRWERPARAAVVAWATAAAAARRQRLCNTSGTRAHLHRVLGRALAAMRLHARRARAKRLRTNGALLAKVFAAWAFFAPLQARERRLSLAADRRGHAAILAQHRGLLRRWRAAARTRRRLLRTAEAVAASAARGHLRRGFATWRGRWLGTLLWRRKDADVEAARAAALLALRECEAEDLRRERERAWRETADAERMLLDLRHTLEERQLELQGLEEAAAAAAQARAEAQTLLEAGKEELRDARNERDRMRAVESAVAEERARVARQAQEQQEVAERTLRALEAETAALRADLEKTRKWAARTEEQAQAAVAEERARLVAAQEAAAAAEATLRAREAEAAELRATVGEQRDAQDRLEATLAAAQRAGAAATADAEKASRGRGAALRVAQADAGLARARVAQLRALADEHRALLRRLALEGLAEEEHAELRELAHIEDALLRAAGSGAGAGAAVGSPTRRHDRGPRKKASRADQQQPSPRRPVQAPFSHTLPARATSSASPSPTPSSVARRRGGTADRPPSAPGSPGLSAISTRSRPPLLLPPPSLMATDGSVLVDDFYASDTSVGRRGSQPPPPLPSSSLLPRGGDGADGSPGHTTSTASGDGVSYPSTGDADGTGGSGSDGGSDGGGASRDTFSLTGMSSSAAPLASTDASVAPEAPSAIIDRMRRRMAALGPALGTSDSDPDPAEEEEEDVSLYPRPLPAVAAGGAYDTLHTTRESVDVSNHILTNRTTAAAAAATTGYVDNKHGSGGLPRGSPAKTDEEEADEEESGEYDAADEDRRYQAARAALRGIIRAHPSPSHPPTPA